MIAAVPPAVLDAWLLERFPGKTLDELDQMDFPRYVRAMAVQRIQNVERVRELQMQNKYQPTPAEWRQILLHDAWADDID